MAYVPLTVQEVDTVATGLGSAAWCMNLTRFCEALGNPEDDYAKEKFRQFQELARLLGRFDTGTLTALLRAQGVPVAEPPGAGAPAHNARKETDYAVRLARRPDGAA